MFSIRVIALLAMAFLSGCATYTTVREHPQLESQLSRIDSVVITPAMVTIQQINFTGNNERLTELEASIQGQLYEIAKTQLTEQGYRIVDFDFQTAINEDEDFAYAVTQVREGFSEAKGKLYQRLAVDVKEKRSIQASVGPSVNMIAEKSVADAVLLMQYAGSKKSSGSVAKDVAVSVVVTLLTGSTPIPNKEASVVELALLDGTTGDVIWSNILNHEQLSTLGATRAFQTLPADIDPVASN